MIFTFSIPMKTINRKRTLLIWALTGLVCRMVMRKRTAEFNWSNNKTACESGE